MSWDDLSGAETQPWSAIKSWAVLTDMERAAAAVLGYGAITWDNDSGNEPQPISMEKRWSELSSCVGGENLALHCWLCDVVLLMPVCFLLPGIFAVVYSD